MHIRSRISTSSLSLSFPWIRLAWRYPNLHKCFTTNHSNTKEKQTRYSNVNLLNSRSRFQFNHFPLFAMNNIQFNAATRLSTILPLRYYSFSHSFHSNCLSSIPKIKLVNKSIPPSSRYMKYRLYPTTITFHSSYGYGLSSFPIRFVSEFNKSNRLHISSLSPLTRKLIYVSIILSFLFTSSLFLLSFTSPNSTTNRFAYETYVFCYAIVRVTRDVYTVVRIVWDYVYSLYGLDRSTDIYATTIEQVHWRCASRLRDCFNANGGVYIKFGQHLAQMMYLLPEPYCETMQSMLQQAPTSPYPDIEAIVTEELGHPINEIFASFSPLPVASASLAQVHFATLQDGTDVAIKVQHRFLQHTIDADIYVVRHIVNIIHYFFPSFDYGWLANEMSISLPKECNFLLEGENADICRNMLAHRDDIKIPNIFWNYSSPRLLCMERINGIMIGNTKGLVEAGLNKKEISTLVAEIFSEMIFTHGRVHADPHPGNVYVSKYKNTNKPLLILLDHGLYSVINDDFRLKYANLWKALICANKSDIQHYAQDMNAGELYPLFAAMLTRRPWDEISNHSLTKKNVAEFQKEELQEYIALYGLEIQKILATVPQELVLLLKTNECLRHIDTILGSQNETFLIMARFCTAAINKDRSIKHPGLITSIINIKDYLNMEIRILFVETIISMAGLFGQLKELLVGAVGLPFKFVLTKLRRK